MATRYPDALRLFAMTILHTQVRNGRVVVDEPTGLPDGVKVALLVLDAAADMPPAEQAALEASIDRGLAEADRGVLHSVDEVLDRLRRI
jgi:hypothetical protein